MPDHARPLNARGRQGASAMGDAIRALGLQPELVLVSSSRRTLQTLEALAPWAQPPRVEPLDRLYLAPGSALLQVVNELPDATASVMLVAHNPGLHELALLLLGGQEVDRRILGRLGETYPTGALAEFAIPMAWPDLRRGGAILRRFLTPADLPVEAARGGSRG